MATNRVVKEITINSEVKNIAIVEKLVEDICAEVTGCMDIFGNILVTVSEAVTNCIIHGNNRDSSKFVTIKMSYDIGEILFEISDEGHGFDLNLVPDPTKEENIENPHGRGIFLMKKLCDEFSYSVENRSFNLKFYPLKSREPIR
ncbi:MAG TPA: ATP-binding protein [Salinivirgaceae bacterium]|nr:ATP-binding protein [Salinivirgaceae bacterium]